MRSSRLASAVSLLATGLALSSCRTRLLDLTEDAAGVSPPCAPFTEKLVVPSDGSVVTSSHALVAECPYRLRAEGKFHIGGPGDCDAQFSFSPDLSTIIDHCFNDRNGAALGLAVDDPMVGSVKQPDSWGAFSKSHVYEIDWKGKGAPLSFNIHDCQYDDNVGSLSVTILSP